MGGFGPASMVCSSGEVPGVTTPMQSRRLHPNEELPVNKRFTPCSAPCLRAFVLSGLASFLAGAQGVMISHIPLKVLGILVLGTVIRGRQLESRAGRGNIGTPCKQRGVGLKTSFEVVRTRLTPTLSSSWCLISHNLQRGWQYNKMLGYA